MKRLMIAVTAIALATGLAGCYSDPGMHNSSSSPIVADPAHPFDAVDGNWCGSGANGPVYIDIVYAPDGTPSAEPGPCTVSSGTEVTWRGPDGEPVDFEIRFKTTSPVLDDTRLVLSSLKGDKRYKVKRQISGAPGQYDYGIKANGKETDPAIIIK